MLASFLNPPVLGHTHTTPLSRTASSPAHSFYTDIYSALLLPLLRAQRQKNNFLLASLTQQALFEQAGKQIHCYCLQDMASQRHS